MWCQVSKGQAEDPCGVCMKGVGDNSILCIECFRWVHKRCSGISGMLKSNVDFDCIRCLEGNHYYYYYYTDILCLLLQSSHKCMEF